MTIPGPMPFHRPDLVPVPAEVRRELAARIVDLGIKRTVAALHISPDIVRDAATPGARVRPPALARLTRALGLEPGAT